MDFDNYTLQQLEAGAGNLENEISSVIGDVDLSFSPEIDSQKNLVLCRSREWTSKAFFIIVVGPVKSGKSTFVNLLAHAHVSPTHFLECTVRPSIISKAADGNECSITSYNCDSAPSIEVVDSVIDSIKGLDFAFMNGVTVDVPCALNEKNLEEKVARNIDLLKTEKQVTILTSITAPGGDFLTEDVFLIDMPGFDGIVSNIELPFYEAIINRADLVVFIQSSNSAISKISGDFFDILKKRNGSVPMLFIHNNFDSAYWHPIEDRICKAEEQVNAARDFFKAKYHPVAEDDCKRINLGKVDDYRSGADFSDFTSDLKSESDLFTQIERELHERILSSKGTVRLINCLNRTLCELNRLTGLTEDVLTQKKNTKEEYGLVKFCFSNFRRRLIPPVSSDILKNVELTPDGVINKLSGIKHAFINSLGLSSDDKYKTTVVRDFAKNLINNYKISLEAFIKVKLDEHTIVSLIQSAFKSAVNNSQDDEFSKLSFKYQQYISIPDFVPDGVVIDYSPIEGRYDVNKKIPTKALWGKYSYNEILAFMNGIEMTYLGIAGSGQRTGYIQTTFLQDVLNDITVWVDAVIKCYNDKLSAVVDSMEQSILNQIVDDIITLDAQISLLEETLTKLKSMTKSVE